MAHLPSRTVINAGRNAPNLVKIRDGICIMGEDNVPTLHYFTLPSRLEDSPSWSRLDLDTQLRVINFDFAFYDYDLLAVATTRPNDTTSGVTIEIQLIQLSAGKPHPLAHNPILCVQDIKSSEYLDLQIINEYVAITTARNQGGASGCLIVINWRTSAVHMTVHTSADVDSGFFFLSEDAILLPNTADATLDIYPISNEESSPDPILRLSLPESNYRELFLTFQSSESSSSLKTSKSSHDTVLLMNIDIILSLDQITDSFCIFVHRSDLMKLYASTLQSHTYGETLEWEAWGPAITRWFRRSSAGNDQWATSGQRCAIMKDKSNELRVLDFEKLKYTKDDSIARKNDENEEDGLSFHTMEDCLEASSFEGIVKHSLPYTSRSHCFDSDVIKAKVFLEEGRLVRIGTRTDNTEGFLIEVFHLRGG